MKHKSFLEGRVMNHLSGTVRAFVRGHAAAAIGLIVSLFFLQSKADLPYLLTPLPLEYRATYHYPLPYYNDLECSDFNFDFWAAGYQREMNRAFLNNCGCVQDVTTHTEALLELYYTGFDFDTVQSTIYTDKGLFVGIEFDKAFGACNFWHVGYRAILPIKAMQGSGGNVGFFQQRAMGLGNLAMETYIGYHTDDWFLDLDLGGKFPTDKVVHEFNLSTGNFNHYEFRVGPDFGWRPLEWFALTLDGTYNHVFKAREVRQITPVGTPGRQVTQPFAEATNHWGYFWGHVGLNFFHPDCCDLGLLLQYEIYTRTKDHVRFCSPTYTQVTVNGPNVIELDDSIVNQNTNALANKVRAEVFYRICGAEIFAEASQIIAGRFVFQETEWHLGFKMYF